jgi:hypothetical protein
MSHVNQNDIKPYLNAFVTMLSMTKLLLPGGKLPQLDLIVKRLTEVAQSTWCTDLICYLVNTFGDRPASDQELGAALAHFGNTVQSGQAAPKTFKFQGEDK